MSKETRTLFIGMPGQFSCIVLRRLLVNNVRVVGVLLNGKRSVPLRKLFLPEGLATPHPAAGFELPLLNAPVSSSAASREEKAVAGGSSDAGTGRRGEELPASLPALAFQEGIPAYECGEIGHPDVTGWLAEKSLDVVCVACWNQIIPPSVLGIPRHGFLNVHPSILPAYRGPFPLFWQFRAGETKSGVSVHWMDAGLDTGDIAAQRVVRFEDGMRGSEAEALCATSGGDLLAEVFAKLENGVVLRRSQPAGGSYFPAPTKEDFALDADWHPQRAFNFMRANAEWGIPFCLESGGIVHWLADALEWREEASQEPAGEGRVWASFRGGAVLAVEWSGVAF